jgi:acetyl-CoA carboxylase biotin carboxyl carrier protein
MFGRKKGVSELVDELVELLNKHNLSEIEYEKDGSRIKISNSRAAIAMAASGMPANSPTAASVAAACAPLAGDLSNALRSPMVGVVYMRPEPNAKPFVVEGQAVKKGDTLCLIEAMKTFNPVKAPADGVVRKIFIKDSETVEYEQPLFVIE